MIEEIGIVSQINRQKDRQTIWVETQIKTTCGSCEAQSNCGTSTIAKAFAPKHEQLCFDYDHPISIGQKVKLGIPEESLLTASFLVYLLPLCVLLFCAAFGQFFLPYLGLLAEGWIILFAGLATLMSFKVVGFYLKKTNQQNFYPRILAVLPTEIEQIQVQQLEV
jgi:sigma-E factor negative regulatory protein RseC